MRKTGQIRKNYCASFWLRFEQLFEIHHSLVWQQGLEHSAAADGAGEPARAATLPHGQQTTHHVSRLFRNIWLNPS
jgi:hypothetical protein